MNLNFVAVLLRPTAFFVKIKYSVVFIPFSKSHRMWARLDETLAIPVTKAKTIKLGKDTGNEPADAECPRSEMICGRFEVRYVKSLQCSNLKHQ